ncbi:MAG: hypothetical protein AAGC71_12790 [Pseudomonadota bacterium]
MLMRRIIWTVIVTAWTAAAAAATEDCSGGKPAAEAPAALQDFAFLIGRWRIDLKRQTANGWSPPRPQHALWTGRYALDGMAIYDEWFDTAPDLAPATPRGANLRVYNSETKQWLMTWIHTSGLTATTLTAERRGDAMIMWQSHPTGPAWEAEFIVESADRWTRTQYQIDENGERSAQYLLIATRLPCTDSTD